MKALSMVQPYAWLFANGLLRIDDRPWKTSFRGPVAIHASKRFHAAYYEWLAQNTNVQMPAPAELERGGVVGVANLVDCLAPVLVRPEPLALTRSHFGTPGMHGLVFADARPVAHIPANGALGLFELSFSS